MDMTPPHWTSGAVNAAGTDIFYRRTGEGRATPLLLAHGFSDNGACWGRVVSALEGDIDIVMLDTRNHGRSGTGPGDPERLVDDIAAVVAALGLDRVSLMGHSIGARTMAEFAARDPGVVDRLVLEDPPWRAGEVVHAKWSERVKQARSHVRSLGEMTEEDLWELARSQHSEWAEADYPAWVEAKQQLRPESADSLEPGEWESVVANIQCPTLLVAGQVEKGGIINPEVARRVGSLNPSISSVAVDQAGHNIRRENFEGLVAAVRAFLTG